MLFTGLEVRIQKYLPSVKYRRHRDVITKNPLSDQIRKSPE